VRVYATAVLTVLAVAGLSDARAAPTWTEGKHYFNVVPLSGRALPPGQVEVIEVFSYGCPACAQFNPVARRLQQSLPKTARFVYVPAAFNAAEDWPMFQRAYCTAEVLGIADKTHDAMFDAVWKGGEMAISDPATGRLKSPLPTIETAAHFYSRLADVKVEDFLATAKSFTVEMKIKEADNFIRSYQVLSTPTIIVNRKYRTEARSAGGYDELIQLVTWLVAKDGG
jgi:protein dithiol oxidoreductase (disulfide-forming)